ncbi:TPA: glycosyl transferase family 2 [Candidatus Saccharibacteria bacterium]|nr:glycosyl transferase family 2 [Candidatus Saccharibacteria bacterium]
MSMRSNFKAGLYREATLFEQRLSSPTVSLILAGSILGAFIYLFFLLQPSVRGDLLPYILTIIAEFFLVSQGVLSFWTILSGRANPRHFEYHNAQNGLFGQRIGKSLAKDLHEYVSEQTRELQMYMHRKKVSVDVFIPVYGEPVDEIKATAQAARDMYGKHETYILDDGESDNVKKMARRIGVGYIRRPRHDHAKAGNINYALRQTKGDFFVILDADFVAKPEFLYETLPFFEDKEMAMVQTPQFYSNALNFVSTAAGYMQHIFYSMLMSGKNRFNAAFCVGTCVVFRREAIKGIGGMYDRSKSEDIWTSLKLHEKGWRTVYINKVLAEGKTPETLKAYSKQQLRWATGSFEIFLKSNPLLNFKLSVDQRLQYFLTTTFYFNGFVVLALLILPALQIYFNISPIALSIPLWQWALLYSGFYVMQLMLSFYAMGGLRLETIMISAASYPIYVKAFFNALFGRDQAWAATNARDDQYDSPFNYIRIQAYTFLFLLLTTVVGVWKAYYTAEFSIAVVWAGVMTAIFGYFVRAALREGRQLKREAKKAAVKQRTLQGSKA